MTVRAPKDGGCKLGSVCVKVKEHRDNNASSFFGCFKYLRMPQKEGEEGEEEVY